MGPPSGRDFQISTPGPGFQKLGVKPGLGLTLARRVNDFCPRAHFVNASESRYLNWPHETCRRFLEASPFREFLWRCAGKIDNSAVR
jgi:hypothetical protein